MLASHLGHGQVPANLLPVVGEAGEYVRTANEEVRVVEVSNSGLILECCQKAAPGLQPFTWRERYTVHSGRLVLDAVLTPHIIPPQPAHTEWQISARIGTSNIGPTALDSRWDNYGSYLQRMIEAVQGKWDQNLAEGKIYPNVGTVVSVRFVMDSKGAIVQILRVQPSRGTPDEVIGACINAVTIQAPYGDWTDEMIAALGTEQEITLSFYCR